MQKFRENWDKVVETVSEAARRAGRNTSEVTLVAVTKTVPAEVVRLAVELGHQHFGENRVQEALAKAPLLSGNLHWHLIGHLQTNKIRKALPLFERIHSVDSVALACEIDHIAATLGLFPRVLLEVNISGEASKFGFMPAELLAGTIEDLLSLKRLQIDGLMTLAPLAADPEKSRPIFSKLREFRDQLVQKTGVPLLELSMGMSGDYAVAVEEGATWVRVGSALYRDAL